MEEDQKALRRNDMLQIFRIGRCFGQNQKSESQVMADGIGRGFFTPERRSGNLFVERAFNQGNPEEKPFPFTPSRSYLNTGIGRMRHYSAAEIYSGRLLNFKLVKKTSAW